MQINGKGERKKQNKSKIPTSNKPVEKKSQPVKKGAKKPPVDEFKVKPIMKEQPSLYNIDGSVSVDAMNIVNKELGYEGYMPKIIRNEETHIRLEDKVICTLPINQFPQGETTIDAFTPILKASKNEYVSIVVRPAKLAEQIADLQKQKETNEAKLIQKLDDMERTKIEAKLAEIESRLQELALSTNKNFLVEVTRTIQAPKLDTLEMRIDETRLLYTRMNLRPKRPNFKTLSKVIEHSVSTKNPTNFDGYETFNQDSLGTLIPFRERDIITAGNYIGTNLDTSHPFIVDFFEDVNGINYQNKNMVMLGINGSGKTFTALTFLLGSLSQGPVTAIVDSESQFAGAALEMGGINIEFKQSSQKEYGFNFFDVGESAAFKVIKKEEMNNRGNLVISEVEIIDEDKKIVNLNEKVKELVDVIGTMYELTSKKQITSSQRNCLNAMLFRIYKKYGVTEDVNSLYEHNVMDDFNQHIAKRKRTLPTIGDFVELLKQAVASIVTMRNEGTYIEDQFELKNHFKYEDVASLYTSLVIFSKRHGGTLTMFDVQTKPGDELSNWENVPIVNFDISDLIAKPNMILTPLVLKIVFKWLKADFVNTNLSLSKVAMIDELFRFVGNGSPWREYVAADIEDFYRTFRKRNARIITMTQNLIELNNDVGKSILSQSAYKVLLRHNPVDFQPLVDVLKISDSLAHRVTSIGQNPGEFYMQMGDEHDILHIKTSGAYSRIIEDSYLRGKKIKTIIEKEDENH